MNRVRHWLIRCGAASLFLTVVATRALPQDMTVYTTVSAVGEDGASRSVGRSLTLFHAGKVYDYMEDVGELVVLEPRAGRFVIMNGNYTAARVEADELNQFLKVADTHTNSYIAELSQQPEGASRPMLAWLRFQLQPEFQEDHDAGNRLKLSSDVMSYDVETAAAPDPQNVEQYLAYADWAARLNFVLHPGSTFPAPRLALNEALRRKQALPVSVKLVSTSEKTVALRADHKFQWELLGADKSHINKWERLLESKQIRWVGFHEYQQRLIAASQKRAK